MNEIIFFTLNAGNPKFCRLVYFIHSYGKNTQESVYISQRISRYCSVI